MKRWIAVFLMVSILFSAVAAQAEAKELSEEQILVQTEVMEMTDFQGIPARWKNYFQTWRQKVIRKPENG